MGFLLSYTQQFRLMADNIVLFINILLKLELIGNI